MSFFRIERALALTTDSLRSQKQIVSKVRELEDEKVQHQIEYAMEQAFDMMEPMADYLLRYIEIHQTGPNILQ